MSHYRTQRFFKISPTKSSQPLFMEWKRKNQGFFARYLLYRMLQFNRLSENGKQIKYMKFLYKALLKIMVLSLYSNHVRLAATNALLNSLEFTKANFDKEVIKSWSVILAWWCDIFHLSMKIVSFKIYCSCTCRQRDTS